MEGCRVASRLLCKQKVPNPVSPILFLEFPFSQETASGKEEIKHVLRRVQSPMPREFSAVTTDAVQDLADPDSFCRGQHKWLPVISTQWTQEPSSVWLPKP